MKPGDRFSISSAGLVDAILDAAEVKSGESLCDLGSGSGCIVRAALDRGADAFGVEYDAELVRKSSAILPGRIIYGDILKFSLGRYDVVVCTCTDPETLTVIEKIAIATMKPGSRLVMLGERDGWKNVETEHGTIAVMAW